MTVCLSTSQVLELQGGASVVGFYKGQKGAWQELEAIWGALRWEKGLGLKEGG